MGGVVAHSIRCNRVRQVAAKQASFDTQSVTWTDPPVMLHSADAFLTCTRRPPRVGTVAAAPPRACRFPLAPLDWGPDGAAGHHAAHH